MSVSLIMCGAVAQDTVSLSDLNVIADQLGGTATAIYRLAAIGQVQRSTNGSPFTSPANWLDPPISMAAYECRATDGGTTGTGTFTGTLATWQALTSDRSWQLVRSSGTGTVTKALTIEIRRAVDSVVMATASISLTAIWDV